MPACRLTVGAFMDKVLYQTAAAILGLDTDYSTRAEIEGAKALALAQLPPGDDVAVQMIERAAALLLSGLDVSNSGEEATAIDEGVSIGPYAIAGNVERLQELGITAMISVDAARPPLFEVEMADVRVHHLKWADPSDPVGAKELDRDFQADLDAICDFIAAEKVSNAARGGQPGRVLISCSRGDARSQAAACAFLVRQHGWKMPEATAHVARQLLLQEPIVLPEPLAEELRKFAHGVTGTGLKIGARKKKGNDSVLRPSGPADCTVTLSQPEPAPEPEHELQLRPDEQRAAKRAAKEERDKRVDILAAALLAEEAEMEREALIVTGLDGQNNSSSCGKQREPSSRVTLADAGTSDERKGAAALSKSKKD